MIKTSVPASQRKGPKWRGFPSTRFSSRAISATAQGKVSIQTLQVPSPSAPGGLQAHSLAPLPHPPTISLFVKHTRPAHPASRVKARPVSFCAQMQTQLEVESKAGSEMHGKEKRKIRGGESAERGWRSQGQGRRRSAAGGARRRSRNASRAPATRARPAGSGADSHGRTAAPLSTAAGGWLRDSARSSPRPPAV